MPRNSGFEIGSFGVRDPVCASHPTVDTPAKPWTRGSKSDSSGIESETAQTPGSRRWRHALGMGRAEFQAGRSPGQECRGCGGAVAAPPQKDIKMLISHMLHTVPGTPKNDSFYYLSAHRSVREPGRIRINLWTRDWRAPPPRADAGSKGQF